MGAFCMASLASSLARDCADLGPGVCAVRRGDCLSVDDLLVKASSAPRASSKRPSVATPSPAADSSSTEYVPVAERGWKGVPPLVDDANVQPHRQQKKRRRLAREASERRVRLLGDRVLRAFGRAAVDELWSAAKATLAASTSSPSSPEPGAVVS